MCPKCLLFQFFLSFRLNLYITHVDVINGTFGRRWRVQRWHRQVNQGMQQRDGTMYGCEKSTRKRLFFYLYSDFFIVFILFFIQCKCHWLCKWKFLFLEPSSVSKILKKGKRMYRVSGKTFNLFNYFFLVFSFTLFKAACFL